MQVLLERFNAEQAGANQLTEIMLLDWKFFSSKEEKKIFNLFLFISSINNLVCEYCFEEGNGAILK